MARSFEFKGTRYDQGALAQALQGTVAAELQASNQKAAAYGFIAEALLRQVEAAQARGFQRKESALDRALRTGESELDRGFRREVQERDIAADRQRFDEAMRTEDRRRQEQNRLNAELQRFESMTRLSGAAAEQGYPAPELIELQDERFQSNPVLNPGAAPVGPMGPGVPPGGPGGFMVGPQGGDPLYQSLMREGGGGRKFTDLKPMPQAQGIETRKYEDQLKKARVREELNAYFMSPKGQKALTVPIKVKNRDAYELPETMLPLDFEASVKRLWPDYAPKTVQGELGKPPTEDRTAFDALVKWLNEEHEEQIPMSAPMREVAGQLIERFESQGVDPALVDEVLNEFWQEHKGFAASPDQARQMALARRLDQVKRMERDPRPAESSVQASSFSDLLGDAAEQRTTAKVVGGELQPMPWTKQTIQAAGFEYSRLPPGLQAAAELGMTIAPDQNGRMVFQPLGNFQPPPEWQAELDAFQQEGGGQLEASSAAGAESVSPKDVKEGAAGRRMASAPTAHRIAPKAESTPAPSAMERYEALKAKKVAPNPKLKVPPVMRLVNDETALLRLLLGAGGGR